MSLKRCAIVDPNAGRVVNVVEYENVPAGDVPGYPLGYRAIETAAADTRWSWDGSAFIAPPASAAPTPTLASYESAIQAHIDTTARGKNYADGTSLASYISSTVAAWAAEAGAFITWRDDVWLYVYAQLAAVEAGQRTQPSVNELLAELPKITWPQ